jgi:hypothetical protein
MQYDDMAGKLATITPEVLHRGTRKGGGGVLPCMFAMTAIR